MHEYVNDTTSVYFQSNDYWNRRYSGTRLHGHKQPETHIIPDRREFSCYCRRYTASPDIETSGGCGTKQHSAVLLYIVQPRIHFKNVIDLNVGILNRKGTQA